MTVVSFTDYTPLPRFDNVGWDHVRIFESPSQNGPWTQIDDINLGVDPDPVHPLSRSFTTNNATLVTGWYKVEFYNGSGDTLPTEPLYHAPRLDAEYLPTLHDVGLVSRGRTLDDVGNELGTFTAKTRPTDEAVRGLINQAGDDVRDKIGGEIPADLREKAQRVIALRTAMLIELSYYSSEVATDRSPYRQLKELFDELLPDLVSAVAAEEGGADVDDSLTGVGTSPSFDFGTDTTWMTRRL